MENEFLKNKIDLQVLRGRWPVVFAAVSVLLAGWYWIYAGGGLPRGGTFSGLAFGVLAFLLTIFLMVYKARKHVYHLRIGPTSAWLTAHVYLGVIAGALVLMHMGFHVSGTFGGGLFVLFALTMGSGVAGSLIFKLTPISLMKDGREMMTRDILREKIAKCAHDADSDLQAASEQLKKLYRDQIRPYLELRRIPWSYLLKEERTLIRQRRRQLEALFPRVSNDEKYHLRLLQNIVVEKERFTMRLVKLELFDFWLWFHLPVSFVVFAMILFHLFMVLYY